MTIPAEAYRAVMFLLFILAGVILWRMARGKNRWDFVDMFLTHKDGVQVADRQAFVLMGAFFASTVWGTMLTMEGKLTEWFTMAYLATWAGSHFGSRWLRAKEDEKK